MATNLLDLDFEPEGINPALTTPTEETFKEDENILDLDFEEEAPAVPPATAPLSFEEEVQVEAPVESTLVPDDDVHPDILLEADFETEGVVEAEGVSNTDQLLGRVAERNQQYPFLYGKALKGALVEQPDMNVSDVLALSGAETGFGQKLSSFTGVKGIMQVTKSTGQQEFKENNIPRDFNRDDPKDQFLAGSLHLKRHLETFGGDYDKAIAAYNAGASTVRQAERLAKRNGTTWLKEIPNTANVKKMNRDNRKTVDEKNKDRKKEDRIAYVQKEDEITGLISRFKKNRKFLGDFKRQDITDEQMEVFDAVMKMPRFEFEDVLTKEKLYERMQINDAVYGGKHTELRAAQEEAIKKSVIEQQQFLEENPEVAREVQALEQWENPLALGYLGLISGLDQVGATFLGDLTRFVGGIVDVETVKKWGDDISKAYRMRPAALARPEILDKAPGIESWFDRHALSYGVGQMVPQLALMLGGGGVLGGAAGATAKGGARLLGKQLSQKALNNVIHYGMATSGGVLGGTMEGMGLYREMLDQGFSEAEARNGAILMGSMSAGLNTLGLAKIMKKLPDNLASKIFGKGVAGVTEMVTEIAEEPASVLAKEMAGKGEQYDNIIEGMTEAVKNGLEVGGPAFIVGALLGGNVNLDIDKFADLTAEKIQQIEAESNKTGQSFDELFQDEAVKKWFLSPMENKLEEVKKAEDPVSYVTEKTSDYYRDIIKNTEDLIGKKVEDLSNVDKDRLALRQRAELELQDVGNLGEIIQPAEEQEILDSEDVSAIPTGEPVVEPTAEPVAETTVEAGEPTVETVGDTKGQQQESNQLNMDAVLLSFEIKKKVNEEDVDLFEFEAELDRLRKIDKDRGLTRDDLRQSKFGAILATNELAMFDENPTIDLVEKAMVKTTEEELTMSEIIGDPGGNLEELSEGPTSFVVDEEVETPDQTIVEPTQPTQISDEQKAEFKEKLRVEGLRKGQSEEDAESTAELLMNSTDPSVIALINSHVENVELRGNERAETDQLTGLKNRTWLTAKDKNGKLINGKEIVDDDGTKKIVARDGLQIMFDIDHFKKFNDTYGHNAGDKVLIELSSLIRKHFDALGTTVRYGGEEIGVVFNEGVTTEQAQKADQALRNELGTLDVEGEPITYSAGIAETYNDADALLFQAKDAGRNQTKMGGIDATTEVVTDKKDITEEKGKTPVRDTGKKSTGKTKPRKPKKKQPESKEEKFVKTVVSKDVKTAPKKDTEPEDYYGQPLGERPVKRMSIEKFKEAFKKGKVIQASDDKSISDLSEAEGKMYLDKETGKVLRQAYSKKLTVKRVAPLTFSKGVSSGIFVKSEVEPDTYIEKKTGRPVEVKKQEKPVKIKSVRGLTGLDKQIVKTENQIKLVRNALKKKKVGDKQAEEVLKVMEKRLADLKIEKADFDEKMKSVPEELDKVVRPGTIRYDIATKTFKLEDLDGNVIKEASKFEEVKKEVGDKVETETEIAQISKTARKIKVLERKMFKLNPKDPKYFDKLIPLQKELEKESARLEGLEGVAEATVDAYVEEVKDDTFVDRIDTSNRIIDIQEERINELNKEKNKTKSEKRKGLIERQISTANQIRDEHNERLVYYEIGSDPDLDPDFMASVKRELTPQQRQKLARQRGAVAVPSVSDGVQAMENLRNITNKAGGKVATGAKNVWEFIQQALGGNNKAQKIMGVEFRRLNGTRNALQFMAQSRIVDITTKLSDIDLELVTFLMEKTGIPKKLGREDLEERYKEYLKNPELRKQLDKTAMEVKGFFQTMFKFMKDGDKKFNAQQIRDYVTHIWEIKTPEDQANAANWLTEKFKTENPFSNRRFFKTYEEGIKKGYIPKNLSIAKLMDIHARYAIRTIANQQFIDLLKHISTPENPMIALESKVITKNGKRLPKFRDFRKTTNNNFAELKEAIGERGQKILQIDPYLYHKDIEPAVKVMFDTFKPGPIFNAIRSINAFYKTANLGWSLFHHNSLLETSVATIGPKETAKVIADLNTMFKTMKDKNYVLLKDVDLTKRFIQRGGQVGSVIDADIPMVKKALGKINEHVQKYGLAGKGVGKIVEAFDVVNDKNNQVLWDFLHNALKLHAFEMMTQQHVTNNPNIKSEAEAELEEMNIAQFVNDTFGGQVWENLMTNQKTLAWANQTLLSPDWFVSTMRQALSVTGLGDIAGTKEGRALRRQMGKNFWIRAGLYFGIGMNLVNMGMKLWDEEDQDEKKREEFEEQIATLRAERDSISDFKDGTLAQRRKYKRRDDALKAKQTQMRDSLLKEDYMTRLMKDPMSYTMAYNTKGHGFHIFTGRYSTGEERYLRFGKQFRELPEMFWDFHNNKFSPLAAPVKKMTGKLSPIWQLAPLIMFNRTTGDFGKENLKRAKEEGEWDDYAIELLKESAKLSAPFVIQGIANDYKEFTWTDLFAQSSKGLTKNKAKAYLLKSWQNDFKYSNQIFEAMKRNKINPHQTVESVFNELKKRLGEDARRSAMYNPDWKPETLGEAIEKNKVNSQQIRAWILSEQIESAKSLLEAKKIEFEEVRKMYEETPAPEDLRQ